MSRPLSPFPSFFIEFAENGTVLVNAKWPKPKTDEDLAAIIKGYVGGMTLLSRGVLVPLFQHAISLAGKHNNDEQTAISVLLQYNNFKNAIEEEVEDDNDEPLKQPSEVFSR